MDATYKTTKYSIPLFFCVREDQCLLLGSGWVYYSIRDCRLYIWGFIHFEVMEPKMGASILHHRLLWFWNSGRQQAVSQNPGLPLWISQGTSLGKMGEGEKTWLVRSPGCNSSWFVTRLRKCTSQLQSSWGAIWSPLSTCCGSTKGCRRVAEKSECSAVAHKHVVVLSQGKQYYIVHYRHRLSVETLQLIN